MPAMDNAHALIVGIANYQHINKLPPTVLKDAQDVHDLLADPQHCGYPSNNVRLLLDAQATQTAIRQALDNLATRSNEDASVFLYISSHGGRIQSGPHAGEYLLPVDVDYTSDQSIGATAISGEEFTQALRAISARKVVVVLDCCHAAGIGQPKDATAPALKIGLSDRYYDVLKQGRGRVILASSRSTEFSFVLPEAQNSLFTQHVLDGLRGGAPGQGGVIRIFDLFDYVQPKVTAAQPNQHPIFKAEIEENFPVALYLGGKSPTHAPAAPLIDGYEYDVFISYQDDIFARYQGDALLKCVPEQSWLCRLLRELADAGLRVNGAFRAPLGYPNMLYSEDAVKASRYILLALSQAYLDNTYAEFENLIAQHVGIEESQYRLAPVLMEDCTPRLGLRILPILDMSTQDKFELNLERLIYQLRQSPMRR